MTLSSTKENVLVPPEILQGVPKTVVRAIGTDNALRMANVVRKSDGAYIALGGLDSYFQAAKRQQRRIERAKSIIVRQFAKHFSSRNGSLFDEVHFYLICWSRIAKLSWFIAQTTRFRRSKLVLRAYRTELETRVDARDHLEHFEERLPGQPNRRKLANPSDLLNMHGDFLTYGGKRVDIGPASLCLLNRIVTQFRTAMLYDSIEVIAEADVDRANGLIRRAVTEVQLARMRRKWKGLGIPGVIPTR